MLFFCRVNVIHTFKVHLFTFKVDLILILDSIFLSTSSESRILLWAAFFKWHFHLTNSQRICDPGCEIQLKYFLYLFFFFTVYYIKSSLIR